MSILTSFHVNLLIFYSTYRRGLIMGIWNAHTSVGNILGTIIPSFWANPTSSDPNPPWGLSFIVPSLIMGGVAMLVFFLLVVGESKLKE